MSGTLRGSIEHLISNTGQNGTRDIFACTVRFFDAHPQMTRIASQAGGSGLTGAAATALPGFTGSGNQSGENAFGVWRWDKTNGSKVYILLQWGFNSTIGTAPGNPGVGSPSTGVVMQFAMDTSGGNPWNGGTANAGADAKNGTNVWVANGGTLLVWPRGNGPGGSGATIRQYMAGTPTPGSAGTRLSMLTDNDAFWWFIDLDGSGFYNTIVKFGPYVPHADITLPTPAAALAMLHIQAMESTDVSFSTAIGTTAGNSGVAEGGAVVDPADGVRSFRISTGPGFINTAITQPNPYTGKYDTLDVFLRMEDTTPPSKNGLFGKFDPDMLAMIPYIATHDTNTTKTKVLIGGNQTAFHKFLLPWDGVTTPGTGGSLLGIQF